MNRCRQRFWSKVDIRTLNECWPWLGSKKDKGYGQFMMKRDGVFRPQRTHRVAFFLTHGYWPEPECLHTCDNPPCCNPEHLFEGTNVENRADSIAKDRHWYKITLEQASEVKKRWLAGESSVALANEYGISDGHVRNIGRGRNRRAA